MIKIRNLNIKFEDEIIYNNFNLDIEKGEKLAIMGDSGKGKSTFLNLLAGFIPNFDGEIKVDNLDLNSSNIGEIREKIAWLPQDLALNIESVEELVYYPFTFSVNKENRPSKKIVKELFDKFELSQSLLNKKTKEISGGEKQRILIGSCLLLKKEILILDEPTSALDNRIKRKISDYVLSQSDLTVIAVTHDEYWIEKSQKILNLNELNK